MSHCRPLDARSPAHSPRARFALAPLDVDALLCELPGCSRGALEVLGSRRPPGYTICNLLGEMMLLRGARATPAAHAAHVERLLFEGGLPAREAHGLARLLLEKLSMLAPGYAPCE